VGGCRTAKLVARHVIDATVAVAVAVVVIVVSRDESGTVDAVAVFVAIFVIWKNKINKKSEKSLFFSFFPLCAFKLENIPYFVLFDLIRLILSMKRAWPMRILFRGSLRQSARTIKERVIVSSRYGQFSLSAFLSCLLFGLFIVTALSA
jgi:hypothetical protein